MEKKNRPSLIVGLIASIGAHLIISVLLFRVDGHNSRENKVSPIEVEILESANVDLVKKSYDEKQIVEQNKINDDLDKNAKFLSAHNQKVVKQTAARKHGDFQNAKQQSQQQRYGQPDLKPIIGIKNLIPERDFFGGYQQAIKKSKNANNSKGANERNGTESQSRDYLPNVDPGLETLLSTHEFVYYTYYTRIRTQLSQYWEPKIKDKVLNLFRKGRRVASAADRITKVLIVLDRSGTLIKVQVMGESGISDLDEVAVEAFRLAAPFPHPPKGLVESDGTIKIRWDFIVET